MARSNKNQHTIPRIYLQAFTNSKGLVWVADKNLKLYPQKPENILTERDYYLIKFPDGGGTLEIETKYLNGIEGSYADVYRNKIARKETLTKEEKAKMAIFVASMMNRQSMHRESLEKFFNGAKEMITHLRGLPDAAKKACASMPTSSSSESIPADEVLKVGEDIGSFHTSLIPESVPYIAPIIFDMQWVFLSRQPASDCFITSNNPCIMVNPITEEEFGRGKLGSQPGLLQKDVELTLPLSSDIALLCGWQAKIDGAYLSVDQILVNEVNKRTKRYARTIVGSDKDVLQKMVDKIKAYQRNLQTS